MIGHSMALANEDTLGRLIKTATRRVVLVAPGVGRGLAEVILKKWSELGPEAVGVGFWHLAVLQMIFSTSSL